MDISSYISELLFEHDCVIIPNFGGFICNYKPADIHPVLNMIAPPSKAISFNRNLQSNDGLLVNYISNAQNISFDAALGVVSNWVSSSKNLLKKQEEVLLQKIGKFTNDIEGNLQFAPVEEVNYLKTSFGLRTITVEPVLRGKQIDFTEKFKQETKHQVLPKRVWSIAATVLLLISLVALAELMWMGVEIKPLHLDEAGVFSFINTNIFKAPEPDVKLIPIEVVDTIAVVQEPVVDSSTIVVDDNNNNGSNIVVGDNTNNGSKIVVGDNTNNGKNKTEPVKEDTYTAPTNNGHTYYVIIGAFTEDKNIEAAKQRLQQKFPDSIILVQKGNRLTKLGYSVGNNFWRAKEQLSAAQSEDYSFWLLKK